MGKTSAFTTQKYNPWCFTNVKDLIDFCVCFFFHVSCFPILIPALFHYCFPAQKRVDNEGENIKNARFERDNVVEENFPPKMLQLSY